ncbi:MAG TPA: MetS family NSS transporter small subunit [Deltaproteobacteria bacterium]|nr:MAG: hypothetical protein DRG83_18625 [Deltaproteobacteria bacterium]RLB03627.1 MAG: hypothetical protein DRG59_11475 [Deltaproteobacteria bacterium]HDM78688.1 MetS family NSS transporter small subunit [Deltaproteobacteria bacterium]HEC31257.1 MetS family NSS transporter small subunit [Deltaproteobacteria bacterium]
MPLSAWVMLIFGVVVLYGGLIYCVSKTKRHEKKSSAKNTAD